MTSPIQMPRGNGTRHMPNTEEIQSPSSPSSQTLHSDLPIQPRMRAETSSPQEGASSARSNMAPRIDIGAANVRHGAGYGMEGPSGSNPSQRPYVYLRDSGTQGAQGRVNSLLVAAMSQGWARQQQFTNQGMTGLPIGFCTGVSAIWMRLHQSHPEANGDARMHSLMSNQAMNHASIAQRCYLAAFEEHDSRVVGDMKPDERNALEKEARQSMEELYGINGNWAKPHCSFADAKTAAKAMAKVKGYAVMNWDMRIGNNGSWEGHEMAMHRHPGSDSIRFFDPNMGEFKFSRSQAEQFLKDRMAVSMKPGCTGFTWNVRPVDIQGSIRDTPLADVEQDLVTRHASGRAPRTINDI